MTSVITCTFRLGLSGGYTKLCNPKQIHLGLETLAMPGYTTNTKYTVEGHIGVSLLHKC